MFSPARMMFGCAALALLLCIGPARAGIGGLPGVPGVPTVPSAKQATQDVVSKELVKQMGDFFYANQPVRVNGDHLLPTVNTLPGPRFRPVPHNVVEVLFSHAHNGVVDLPPGDYAVAIVTYCMKANAHAPSRNRFRMTPIMGRWADIVQALNYRVGYTYPTGNVQMLSWSLQAGMKYSELSTDSQHLVNAVLSDYKPRLQESFYEQLEREWDQISSKVPGAPSFENALSKMGDVGKAIEEIKYERDMLIAHANDYNYLVGQFTSFGKGRIANTLAFTPWSIIAPGVYARVQAKGSLGMPGVLAIRVTQQATSARMQIAATSLRGLGAAVAKAGGTSLPFTGFGGFEDPFIQPITWTPRPGDDPDPGMSGGDGGGASGGGGDGGAPNMIFMGVSWRRDGGGPAPSSGGGGSSGGGSGSSGGGSGDSSGGGGSSGSSGGSSGGAQNGAEYPGNDFDTGTPCDPPGNVFGVDNGVVVAMGSNALTLGKGSGHGIVCLLLRPFVALGPLGWPDRGTGEIDYGHVEFGLPGHPQPGHLVLLAHYTYATTSTITQLYLKRHVTAVIDYGDVTVYCPELTATLALHGDPSDPNWLSGAELENRLCITGMAGQTMQVKAWVVDGDAVGPTLNHPVDPQTFLYADMWGHP